MEFCYPHGFPEQHKPAVESALAEAEIEFLTAKSRPSFQYNSEIEKLIYHKAKKVFFVLAREARRAGRNHLWSCEQIRCAIEQGLHLLICYAFYREFPSTCIEFFESEAIRKILASPEWKQHLKGMTALARFQAARVRSTHNIPKRLTKIGERAKSRKAFVQPRLEAKGMTASKWADKAGFDTSVIYDYLKGKSNPRPATRNAIAEALGVKASDLPE
jgi:DNA-binding phage protein